MKKILFLLAMIVSLSSCAPYFYEQSISINLKSFAGDDFSISPLEYTGEKFEVIGLIYEEFGSHRTTEYMIERAIANTKKMGANGLMKFDMVKKQTKDQTYYVITGTAVKFK